MLRLSLIGLLIFALHWGGLQLARQWGQQITPPPTYLEVYDCPLPCWANVRPGVHDTRIFWAVLDNIMKKGGWMYSGLASTLEETGEVIYEFQLDIQPSNQIRLGDALLLYGEPDFVRILPVATLARGGTGRRLILEVYLYWADGYMQMAAIPPGFQEAVHLDPNMWVRQIRYRDPEAQPNPIFAEPVSPWKGWGVMQEDSN